MATLKQLHIFIAVAETLQMSEAARRLYLSQPTVSQTISELEREFHAALFERTSKYLTLTAKGAIFWEYAQNVVESYRRLDSSMKDVQPIREMRVGATITIGNTMLAEILENLRRMFPDIRPRLLVENTQRLEDRLLHNEVDIALIEGIITNDKIAKLPLTEDALEVICARAHPLWGKKQVEAEALRNQDFILREQGSGTRTVFENYMRSAQIPIRVAAESTSSTAIVELVMHNLGLGVLSRRCVQRYTSENRIWSCTIQGMPMNRYFHICYHVKHPVSTQMRDFVQAARQTVEEMDIKA